MPTSGRAEQRRDQQHDGERAAVGRAGDPLVERSQPLLRIARGPSVQRSNAKHYKSNTVTEVVEFEGPHLLPAREGWEEVADYALEWAVSHARQGKPRQAPSAGA